jgi:hypothetical protein
MVCGAREQCWLRTRDLNLQGRLVSQVNLSLRIDGAEYLSAIRGRWWHTVGLEVKGLLPQQASSGSDWPVASAIRRLGAQRAVIVPRP